MSSIIIISREEIENIKLKEETLKIAFWDRINKQHDLLYYLYTEKQKTLLAYSKVPFCARTDIQHTILDESGFFVK